MAKYIGFIDFQKAFDRVPKDKLWKVLRKEEYGICRCLVRAVESLYKDCESRVKNEERVRE